MDKPQGWTARDVRGELEARVGLEPLDTLLDQRATLVKQVADLRARHGPFGTWDDMRKAQLATIAQSIRARATRDGAKKTEAAVSDEAHADERYVACITTATQERAQLTIAEDEIQAINDRILRDQALARFAAAEAHLAR